MDVLHDEFCMGRNDFVGGIDNDALDFSQLEDFINNEDENENTYFVDTLGTHDSGRNGGVTGATIVVVETPDDGRLHSLHTGNSRPPPPPFTLSHNLPDSPPDSGSEPPYSPQQDSEKNLTHSKHSGQLTSQEILLHPAHPSLYTSAGGISLKGPHLHPVPSGHLHEAMLMQHPGLTPLLSANSAAILNSSARNDTILLTRNETAAILDMGGAPGGASGGSNENGAPSAGAGPGPGAGARSPLLSRVLSSGIGSPTNTLMGHVGQPNSPSLSNGNSNVHTITSGLDGNDADGITTIFPPVHTSKKRKLSEEVNGPVLYVKQEKLDHLDLSPESNSSHAVIGEDGYEIDGVCVDSNFQCIRFQAFQQTQWHVLCDQNLKELPVPHYRVDADKGFNFSNADDAFVCQKKNHFQITCHTQLLGDAHFIKTAEGVKKISSFYLHFYGVKVESPTQIIKVEQSQSDRSKKPFHPVLVELQGEQVTKVTVGRLHFSETTSNNMRKKGKPNPDQRYFYLVVGLHAHTSDNNYQVVAHASERIIVRASNPGQFESDVELCWQKGHTPDSIFHAGRVGINTDRPDEHLVIHGNLKVTGHIVQPSDMRAKLHLQECNTRDQLKNIEKLRVVKYRYADEFAEQLGIAEDTGVIAQEVQAILPDAVRPGGDISLPSGQVIKNFLVVNKDRIYMENVGAVKELCKVTDHLGKRIEEVEKMNRRLAKLKKIDSFKSTSSCSTISSKMTDHSEPRKYGGHKNEKKTSSVLAPPSFVCTNRVIHIAIGILVAIMAICLAAMATLYFLQSQEQQQRQKMVEKHTVWQATPSPRFNTPSIQANRQQPGKRPWTLSTTLSHLADSNKSVLSTTTLSNLLDLNRTRHSVFVKDPRNRDRIKSTRLLPLLHRHTTEPTRPVGPPSLEYPVPGPVVHRSPRPLGRPPHCTGLSSIFHEGDDSTCQPLCCGDDRLLPTSAKLPIVQSPYDGHDEDASNLANTKQNEVENTPQAQASNTIDHGLRAKAGRRVSSETGAVKHARQTRSVHAWNRFRFIRNVEDIIESDSSNLLSEAVADQNGLMVTVYGSHLNQTLTPDFCAMDVPDATLCLDKAAQNFTYNIPISRFYQDGLLFVEFRFPKGGNRTAVMCQELFPLGECSGIRSSPETTVSRANNVFAVELWHHMAANIKYRMPLGHNTQNICLASKQDLGLSYLEYNLNIYRDCED